MFATRFGATTLPDIMADDTMEISSDHGHNTVDEDIDIDIDFTAGHVDEDYVLEDAASNAGFGDSFQPQPSPALGHDDLMIDDGDDSYPMHMDGTDLMRDDDTHNMEDEPLEMPTAPAEIPTFFVDESHVGTTSQVEDGPMNDEVSWEANEDAESELAVNNAKLGDLDAHPESHHNGEAEGDHEDHTDVKGVNEPAAGTSLPESQLNALQDSSPKLSTVGEKSGTPSTTVSVLEDDATEHSSNYPVDISNGSSASQDVARTNEVAEPEETTVSPAIPEVVVIYQDSEYSLFSKYETDDIDSYFLSDISVVDKPLSKLFEALRGVIHNDLGDEEELCLSAEDLGLDIEEMSLMTHSVTIGQIISLHEKLLQNDGVESIRPFCVALGTRPNFSVRFATLVAGASEGKGLSELVQWDEQSESFDDSAHVTDDEHGEVFEGERYQIEERFEESSEKGEDKVPHQQNSDDVLPGDHTSAPQKTDNTESLNASSNPTTKDTDDNNDSLAQQTSIEEVLPLQKNEVPSSGEDEDGDLIDYSDVEDEAPPELQKDAKSRATKLETDDNRTNNGTFTDFIPPCLKPHTCFCSKCNDHLLAEYEAINEELRRRSTSRTAEDNLLEAAEPSVANEGTEYDHETKLGAETGTEYNGNDEENFDQFDPEHEDPSPDFIDDQATVEHHENELFGGNGDVNGDDILDSHNLTTGPTHEDGQERFDDFDFEDDDDVQHQKLPTFDDQETQSNDGHTAPPNGPGEQSSKETFSNGSSLGFADALDSESAASERTLEAQPVSTNDLAIDLNEENEDEIDYDDEEPSVLRVQEPNVKDLQALNNGSTKRQRVDDDGPSEESNEAKRPRS